MSDISAIPSAEYEIFARPPLKAMLGQVLFPPVLKIADLAALGGFQSDIRDQWPEFAQEQQINFIIGPGAPTAQSGPQSLFRFTSADKAWNIVLTTNALTIEAAGGGEYSSFAEFETRFRQVWDVFRKHFGPSAVTRQGLRYVNHLEDASRSPAEWARLINPELVGPLAGVLSEGLEHALSEYRFRHSDAILIFKHGIFPAGPEGQLGYLLDLDHFTDDPSEDVSTETLMGRFTQYHERSYSFFRWCVTDEAVEAFRRGD